MFLAMNAKPFDRTEADVDFGDRSQYVTKIIFSPLRFVNPNPKSQAPYYPNIRNRLEQETDSLSTLELTFGKYISSYQRHIVAQNHLTCNSADFKITARAFKKLPQLGEIVVNHSNDYIGAEAIMKDFVLLTGDELTFDGEYTISKLTLALAAASVRPSYLKFGGDPKSATTAREEPAQDKNSRYKLDFRSPSHSRMTVMGSINSFPELYTYGPEPWAACLGDLQKLDIDLMNFQEAEYGQMLLTARTLGTIVENARNSIKNVNVEELSDRDAEVGTVITTKWEDLFGTHPVTRLRKLET